VCEARGERGALITQKATPVIEERLWDIVGCLGVCAPLWLTSGWSATTHIAPLCVAAWLLSVARVELRVSTLVDVITAHAVSAQLITLSTTTGGGSTELVVTRLSAPSVVGGALVDVITA
jgi:hypothetical protein